MSIQLILLIVAILVAIILAGGIVVGRVLRKEPDRITVTLSMQPQAHCRNEYRGGGSVTVAYPAAGRPARTVVTLTERSPLAPSVNIASSGLSPRTLTFTGPGTKNYTVGPELSDMCADGSLQISATSNPSINLARIIQAPAALVPAKGFELVSEPPTSVHHQPTAAQPDFSVQFEFKCCNAPVSVDAAATPGVGNVNITSPNPQVFPCPAPGQQHTVTITGDRPNRAIAGQFQIKATVGGLTCTVGTIAP